MSTVALNVNTVLAPPANELIVQFNPVPVGSASELVSPPVIDAPTYVTPTGTTSLTLMFVPVTPTVVLVTVKVYVISSPSSGFALSTDFTILRSNDFALISTVPVLFAGLSSVSAILTSSAELVIGLSATAPPSTVA